MKIANQFGFMLQLRLWSNIQLFFLIPLLDRDGRKVLMWMWGEDLLLWVIERNRLLPPEGLYPLKSQAAASPAVPRLEPGLGHNSTDHPAALWVLQISFSLQFSPPAVTLHESTSPSEIKVNQRVALNHPFFLSHLEILIWLDMCNLHHIFSFST